MLTNCTACTGIYFLLNNTCVISCGADYYEDSGTNTCTCNPKCNTCILSVCVTWNPLWTSRLEIGDSCSKKSKFLIIKPYKH